jgi:hypothetical protein
MSSACGFYLEFFFHFEDGGDAFSFKPLAFQKYTALLWYSVLKYRVVHRERNFSEEYTASIFSDEESLSENQAISRTNLA